MSIAVFTGTSSGIRTGSRSPPDFVENSPGNSAISHSHSGIPQENS